MAVTSIICPQCGAPAQMPPGKRICYCEFCGGQIREELSDVGIANLEKEKNFADTISASLHCIASKDYEGAINYADKAQDIIANDPAPQYIKFIAYLPSDFRKATAAHKIAESMRGERESVAMSDEQYMNAIVTFANNYIDDRERDFKRMFATLRKMTRDDLQNVRTYENNKRLSDYYTIPELKEGFQTAASEILKESEESMRVTDQLDQSNWNAIKDVQSNHLFKVAGTIVVDTSLSPRALEYMKKYGHALDMKWEKALKKDIAGGSKDDVRNYRGECAMFVSWLNNVR